MLIETKGELSTSTGAYDELRRVPLRARSKSEPRFDLSLGVLAQLTRDLRR